MLHWYHPSRPLRSAAYPSLVPNKNKTVKISHWRIEGGQGSLAPPP